MHTADRLQFAPPSAPGLLRSIGLAILAHALLLAALTWGVSWRRGEMVTAEAELWAAVPQEAAPPPPEPVPEPAPPPPPPKAAPVVSDADIAIARERQRKIEEQKAQEKLAEQKKREQEKQAAEDKKKKEKLKAQEETKQLEKQRQENMKRITGLAGASGASTATGSAAQSSGPSASYKGRLAALFKRNLVFANRDSIQGNPTALVQVKVAPSGVILSFTLIKSSGIPAWDEAVLRAVERAERVPFDENGKVVPDFPVEFGPKD